MSIATTHTVPKQKRPRKKVRIFHLIEPSGNLIQFPYPLVPLRDHAVAIVQYGSSWRELYWEAGLSLMSSGSPEPFNPLATALLNQPSTELLKGPLSISNPTIYGSAYVLHRTVLMPFVRIRDGITIEEADERVDTMLLGWGCVSQDQHGPTLICANENDLFGAKLAVG